MNTEVILCCGAAAEIVAPGLRRRGWALSGRYLPWLTRPFSAWAVVAAYYELQPWTSFRRGAWSFFPVYGTPWDTFVPGVAGRAAAAAAVFAIAIGIFVVALRSRSGSRWVIPLVVAFAALQLVVSLIPRGWEGPIYPWHSRHKVYGEAVLWMQKTPNFVGRFVEFQPKLSIHSRSHPPGAVAFSYWTVNTRPVRILAERRRPTRPRLARDSGEREGTVGAAPEGGAHAPTERTKRSEHRHRDAEHDGRERPDRRCGDVGVERAPTLDGGEPDQRDTQQERGKSHSR